MRKILDNFLLKRPKLYTILVYAFTLFIGIYFAYIILPVLLNYAPRKC